MSIINRFQLDSQTALVPGASQGVRAAVTMGRFGLPEEIASISLFLVSEVSIYMTGSVVDSDDEYTLF